MAHVYDGGDFYTLLATLGVGLPGQHILDL
jgi:hypothetical protein